MATSVGERVGGEFSVSKFMTELGGLIKEANSLGDLLTPELFFKQYYPLLKDLGYRTQAKGIMEKYIQD